MRRLRGYISAPRRICLSLRQKYASPCAAVRCVWNTSKKETESAFSAWAESFGKRRPTPFRASARAVAFRSRPQGRNACDFRGRLKSKPTTQRKRSWPMQGKIKATRDSKQRARAQSASKKGIQCNRAFKGAGAVQRRSFTDHVRA